METPVNLGRVTPVAQMSGENDVETTTLKAMLSRAESYVDSFRWHQPISARFLGVGIGDVIALFLFKFERPINGTDEWLWVVQGDLPSAYFVVDNAPDPPSALEVYCRIMEDWADAVLEKMPLNDQFPVTAPTTDEYANMLRSRTKFIREQIIPTC